MMAGCRVTVRLVGGGVPWEGRLEAYVKGKWGRVSYRYHRSFDHREASVACYMLGFQ